MPAASILRTSAWALLLSTLLLLPFLNKAFTVDDPTFLAGAAHMLQDPLHPSAFEMVWNTPYRLRASASFANSPVMYILLMPVILAGGAEWVAHLIQFTMLLVGICATVALALRLGLSREQAGWTAAILGTTPAVLAMAGNVMPDVPSMTFGVLAMERLLAWRDSQQLRYGLLSAAFLTCAILSRGHLLLLIAPGALLLHHERLRDWILRCWPLALAPIATVLLLRLTRDPLGPSGMYAAPLSFTYLGMVLPNLVAFCTHLVIALPLALPWALQRYRDLPYRLLLLIVPVVIGVYVWLVPGPKWTAAMVILSMLVLIDILWDGWLRRDWQQLFLGTWLLIPLAALPYAHLPSKYLVAVAPAIAILVTTRLNTRVLMPALAAGAVLGLLILQADTQLASLWREGAAKHIAPRIRAGESVWFAGSWGFYWYAEQAGARPLSLSPPFPKPAISSSSAQQAVYEKRPTQFRTTPCWKSLKTDLLAAASLADTIEPASIPTAGAIFPGPGARIPCIASKSGG